MKSAETIRRLHEKHREANELDNDPIPGFSEEQLEDLESACGHPLTGALRALLKTNGIFAFAPEVFFEDIGYMCLAPPETMIEDAANLRDAAMEYDWDLPSCCSLSLVNNEFIAYDLENETVVAINGDDGEVTELGFGLDELYSRYAELWASELEG